MRKLQSSLFIQCLGAMISKIFDSLMITHKFLIAGKKHINITWKSKNWNFGSTKLASFCFRYHFDLIKSNINAHRINRKTLPCGHPYERILVSVCWTYQIFFSSLHIIWIFSQPVTFEFTLGKWSVTMKPWNFYSRSFPFLVKAICLTTIHFSIMKSILNLVETTVVIVVK